MYEGINIDACNCGAITIEQDRKSNSMAKNVFEKEFSQFKIPTKNTFVNCNHCVNHWGIDLCGCGCGEPVGECEENVCNVAMQDKMEVELAYNG